MSDWDVPTIGPRCYTISELNREARTLLESGFPLLWLQGEISNLARPASGHMYFSLKDADAQVRCALFRFRSRAVNLQIHNGLQVRVQARISLYEPRGEFQLQIEQLELAGAGALRQAFDKLKHQLAVEGLFAVERKRPLPRYARRIGLITSTSGAAIRDVLSVLRRRFPALPVRVYPTAVQGDEAVAGIVRALQQVGEQGACDVVLLVRGGGSLEDLHAFNQEAVARAIVACPIPVVTGVGHETDISIADFAADVRAATPSAAAELVSPDRATWQTRLVHIDQRLQTVLQRQLREQRQQIAHWRRRLEQRHPQRQLRQHAQRLDKLEQQLRQAMQRSVRDRHQQLAALSRLLHTISPLQTLNRGYAIVRDPVTHTIVHDARQLQVDDQVEVLLDQGRLHCQVCETQH